MLALKIYTCTVLIDEDMGKQGSQMKRRENSSGFPLLLSDLD